MPANKAKSFEKQTVRTSEEGRALAARRAGPAIKHGVYELERLGYRRCRPQHCPRSEKCPQAETPAEDRPEVCQPLESHVQAIVGALLQEKRLPPHRRGIIHVVAQRAKQLWIFEGWFNRISPVFTNNGRLVCQPAVAMYERLLSAQARDLSKLGATEVLHLSPSDEYAAAVLDAHKKETSDNE